MATSPAAGGSNPLLVLLDLIDSPLLLFNAEGRVAFANQAAKSSPFRPALVLGSDPQVRDLVKGIAEGSVFPQSGLRVDALSDQGSASLLVRCAPKPIAGLIAATVGATLNETPAATNDAGQAPASSGPSRLSLPQIVEVLRQELMAPMQAVLALPEMSANGHQATADLHERLDRLVQLVEVFGENVLIGDERMVVVELVREACQQLVPLCRELSVSIVLKGEKDDLPPVYGSQKLLARALYECIHNAVKHSRGQVRSDQPVGVEIAFRSTSQHLMVSICSLGALSAAALQRHASSLFLAGALPNPEQTPPKLQIGLPLAQRVLQHHGGQLRVEDDENEGLQVMLEMPTGAPLRNTQQLDLLQAQIYAEDLSKLMARSRSRRSA